LTANLEHVVSDMNLPNLPEHFQIRRAQWFLTDCVQAHTRMTLKPALGRIYKGAAKENAQNIELAIETQ
jgi:hypothetical protein